MTTPERPKSFISAFASGRVWLMVGLGFASGLPNPLTGTTMTTWLRVEGVDLTTIGLFALVHIPYNLKFLWAPFLDRYAPNFLGRRRGWMLICQILVLIAIGVMGTLDPSVSARNFAIAALVLAFVGASQDIVTDAYRTDVLPAHERGSGTAIFVGAFRGGMIVAGAGALALADHVPWTVVYWIMAGAMIVGMVTTLMAPNPGREEQRPKSLDRAFIEPLVEFFTRRRDSRLPSPVSAIIILMAVLTYKVGDAIAGHMRNPFLVDLQFSLTEIGTVVKGFGLGASIVGALIGGGLIARWGLFRCLLLFGVAQATANLLYVVLSMVGKNPALFMVTICCDELFGGLGTAAFVAYLMSLCNSKYTAVQYALLSSAGSLLNRFVSVFGGALAEDAGWPAFFALTMAAGLPSLGFLLVAPRPDSTQPAP